MFAYQSILPITVNVTSPPKGSIETADSNQRLA